MFAGPRTWCFAENGGKQAPNADNSQFSTGNEVNAYGARDCTLPLPPNRTGGSPASGSPVSGFVVVRLYASTRVLLPRTDRRLMRMGQGIAPCPSLRTGLADLPHPALPSVGS